MRLLGWGRPGELDKALWRRAQAQRARGRSLCASQVLLRDAHAGHATAAVCGYSRHGEHDHVRAVRVVREELRAPPQGARAGSASLTPRLPDRLASPRACSRPRAACLARTCLAVCVTRAPAAQDLAFDPASSLTSQLVPCGSAKCLCGRPACGCSDNNECTYQRTYGTPHASVQSRAQQRSCAL